MQQHGFHPNKLVEMGNGKYDGIFHALQECPVIPGWKKFDDKQVFLWATDHGLRDNEGKLYVNDRCNTPGCCNPHITGGLYCAVHTCKEPGCTSSLAISQYNAGYCYTHMKAHGIDEYEFTKIENAKQKAARDAAAAAAAAQAKAKSSGSSTKSSSKSSSKNSGSSSKSSSSGKSSVSTKSSYSSSGSSSSKSSSSSSSKKSSSYYDSYDDGYDDVYYNEWYDENRYRTDWDYMSGVDDAMEDLGEDW